MKKKFSTILMLFAFASSVLFASTDGIADDDFDDDDSPFHLSWLTDGLIAGTGLSLDIANIVLNKSFHLGQKEFSGQIYDMQTVNPFDRAMMNSYSREIDITSDVFAVAMIASPALLFCVPMKSWTTIGAMYAESLIWAFGIKEILKMTVGRVRPYMYYDDFPDYEVNKGDWNTSFPSGHTTYAFTAAAFSTYVFCAYFPDSAWRYAVGFGSYALAATTAFLRVYSGCHFVTDILAGAAIGTFCGLFIPFLHTLSDEKKGEIRVSDQVAVQISPLAIDFRVRL